MIETRHLIRPIPALLAAALLLVAGCSRGPSAKDAKADAAAAAPDEGEAQADVDADDAATPAVALFDVVAGSEEWTAPQAVEMLESGDARSALSAAIRLVRLAQIEHPLTSDPLTAELADEHRLVRLGDDIWAVGRSVAEEAGLAAPLLIRPDGRVDVIDGAPPAALYVSQDADLFPHLLVGPDTVRIVDQDVRAAITARIIEPAGFAWRREGRAAHVAIVLAGPTETVEVARYRWDPFELMFLGPAADALPDPPGGRFEIDLPRSPALVPVGGEIPASLPIRPEAPEVEVEPNEPPPW